MPIKLLLLAIASLLPGLAVAEHAQVPESLKGCVSCHGLDGRGADDSVPTMGGVSAGYLNNQMEQFRAGARPCVAEAFAQAGQTGDHCSIAKDMSDAAVAESSDFYAALDFLPAAQDFDAKKAAAGQRVHATRCGFCHTDQGRNPDDDAGILAGQPMAYLSATLKAYKAGKRWQPDMKAVVMKALDDSAIDSLVHFYASAGAPD